MYTVLAAANFAFVDKLTSESSTEKWWAFNNGFVDVTLENGPSLGPIVRAGHALCAQHAHIHRRIVGPDGKERFTSYRHHLNWTATSIAMLDFDRGDVRMDDLFDNDPFVREFGCLAYTTTSHTEEHPRFRLIFAVERPVQQLENYRRLLAALAWRYATADRGSKNPVHAYAGNRGSNYRQIAQDVYLPVSHAKLLIQDYEEALAAEQRLRQERMDCNVREDPDAEEIAEMLRHLPPQSSYLDWFKTICAVASVYPGETGVSLVEAWSPGYPGEVAMKFRSINESRIGIGWLFTRAMAHGYIPPHKRQRIVTTVIGNALRRRPH